jgi:hypothetical protein
LKRSAAAWIKQRGDDEVWAGIVPGRGIPGNALDIHGIRITGDF